MKKLFLFFVALVFSSILWGQGASTYTFSASSGTYTPITGGTVIVTGTISSLDSWVSPAITIPSFTFADSSFTTAFVTSNGLLSLGISAPSTTSYTAISTTTGSGFSICPFNADLDRVSSDTTTEIRWENVGDEIVFQWTKFKRYNVTENFDFQVRLNRLNGNISFVYKLNSGPGSGTSYQPQVGIRSSSTSYKVVKITETQGTWDAPVLGTSSSDKCRFTSSSPAKSFDTGLTYTFTTPLPCVPPTEQPTGLSFSNISPTSITGNFNTATGADSYLILRSTSTNHTVTPVNGTTYTIGSILGTDTVIQANNSNSFTSSSLAVKTQYDFVVYAMNSLCAGGPIYLTTSPLIASASTMFNEPATFTASAVGTNEITLTATGNSTGENIIVAWELSNTFGTPTGTYNLGDSISGGGKILYKGPASGLTSHTGLSLNTMYYYKAWSYLDTTYSLTGKTANAKTLPLPYTLPFTESFTSTTTLPDGWTSWQSVGSGRSWSAASGGVSSDGCAYSGYYGDIWLISNKITVPANGSIDLRFMQKNTYPTVYNKHGLYYSTTGTKDTNSWIPVNADLGVAPTSWTSSPKYVINNYTGTTLYLAFKYTGNNDDGWYIDNLQVEESPACQQPLTQSVDSITSSGAKLLWTTAPGITEWNVEYGIEGFAQGTGTMVNNITSNSYMVSGLTQSTTYSFYVQSVCTGSQVSAWTGPFSFITSQIPLTIPATIDFENSNGGFILINGTETNQWYIGNAVANGGMNSMYISNDNGVTNAYSHTTSTVHAYRDIHFSSAPGFSLSFDWKAKGESTYDYIKVYLVNPSMNPSAGTEISSTYQIGTLYNGDTIWKTANISLPGSLSDSTKKLVFSWKNDGGGGSQPPGAIDNISIQVIQCPPVSAITPIEILHNSATLSWTSLGQETNWNIEYGPQGFTPGTGTMINANTKPFTITNLNPVTSYSVYIQADCGSGSTSSWFGPYTFTTECAPSTLPYIEDFTTFLPSCWLRKEGLLTSNSILTDITSVWVSGSFAYTGGPSAKINIYGTSRKHWLITPAFDFTGTNPMQIEFDMAYTQYNTSSPASTSGNDDRFVVLVSFDNGITWSDTNILREWNNSGSQYVLNSVPNTGTHAIIALPNYTGNVRFAFYGESTVSNADNDMYIDNLAITEWVSCPKPSNITVTETVYNKAVLNWNAGMNETQWNIEYGPQGFTHGTGTVINGVTSKPYTLTGLNPSTDYSVYIQADCGAGDTSTWSGPVNFTTFLMPNENYPFIEDFETIPNNNGWTIVNGTETNKWYIGSATSNSGQQSAYISNDGGVSNTYSIGTASTVHMFKDFIFPANATNVYIRFNWKGLGEITSGTNYDYLKLSLCDINVYPISGSQSNLTPISPDLLDSANWTVFNLRLDTLAGKEKRLVFTWRNDVSGGSQPPAALDNIFVSLNPPLEIYNLTGGGSYCQTTVPTGIQVKLDSSQVGYDYQLLRNGNPLGSPLAGTGYPLEWNDVYSGNYTVNAIMGTSSVPMNGTVYVYENNASPVSVSLLNPDTSVCQGISVTFTANGINGGTSPTYQWVVNGINVGTNNYQYSYTPANNDTVKCIFTSSLTCNDGPATSTPVVITVNPIVTASIAITSDSTSIHAGSIVTFTASPTNGGSAPVYEWKVNSQSVGTNSPTYAYAPVHNDVIMCIMTSSENCVTNNPATSNSITIDASLSINENGLNSLTIYTANNELVILNDGNGIIRDISIMNLLGQEVFHKVVNSQSSERILLNLNTSTYIVKVTTDKGIITRKINIR